MLQSPWMRVMLEEIESKRRDAVAAREEVARRAVSKAKPNPAVRMRSR
jgi:hypothetical protein